MPPVRKATTGWMRKVVMASATAWGATTTGVEGNASALQQEAQALQLALPSAWWCDSGGVDVESAVASW